MSTKVKIKDIKGGKGGKGKEAAKVKGGIETDSIPRGKGKAGGALNPKAIPDHDWMGGPGGGRKIPDHDW